MHKKQFPDSCQAQTIPGNVPWARTESPQPPGIPHLLGELQPQVSLPLPAPSRCLFWKDVELLLSPLPGSSSQPFHPVRLCRDRKGEALRTSGGFWGSSSRAGRERACSQKKLRAEESITRFPICASPRSSLCQDDSYSSCGELGSPPGARQHLPTPQITEFSQPPQPFLPFPTLAFQA